MTVKQGTKPAITTTSTTTLKTESLETLDPADYFEFNFERFIDPYENVERWVYQIMSYTVYNIPYMMCDCTILYGIYVTYGML